MYVYVSVRAHACTCYRLGDICNVFAAGGKRKILRKSYGEWYELEMEDLRRLRFWRGLVAEFLGTMFLVLFGCAAWIQGDHDSGPDAVRIAFAFTLTYVAVLYCLRSVAEGHINPAVTVALMVTGRSSVVRSLLYVLCQVIGAFLGAALVVGLTPSEYRAKHDGVAIGLTLIRTDMSPFQGLGVEFLATFFFVFVVVACLEKNRREEAVATPVIIGLTYGAVTLFAVSFKKSSICVHLTAFTCIKHDHSFVTINMNDGFVSKYLYKSFPWPLI